MKAEEKDLLTRPPKRCWSKPLLLSSTTKQTSARQSLGWSSGHHMVSNREVKKGKRNLDTDDLKSCNTPPRTTSSAISTDEVGIGGEDSPIEEKVALPAVELSLSPRASSSSFDVKGPDPEAKTFVETLKRIWGYTLDDQRQVYGPLLKRMLPLSHDVSSFSVDQLLMRQMGSAKGKFANLVAASTAMSESQERKIVAVAQSSGAGKTKLCVSYALENRHSIFIRLAFPDFGGKRRYSAAVIELFTALKALSKESDKPLEPEAFQLRSKRALQLLRVFVAAHFDWIRRILIEGANDGWSIEQQREACIRALENGLGEKNVARIFKQQLEDPTSDFVKYVNSINDWFRQRFQDQVVVIVDEAASFREHFAIFYHEAEHKTTATAEVLRNREFEAKNKRPYPTSGSTQPADLFYALRIVVRELLDGYYWAQLLNDTHFSIWDLETVTEISPLRRRVASWHLLDSWDVSMMLDFITEYFDLPVQKQDEELKGTLTKFSGRALFFCGYLIANLLVSVRVTKPDTPQQLRDLLIDCARTQFVRACEEFQSRVIAPAWSENSNPNLRQSFSLAHIVQQLYFRARFRHFEFNIAEKDRLRSITTVGLLAYTDSAAFSLQKEPIFTRALLDLGDRTIARRPPDDDLVFQLIRRPFDAPVVSGGGVKGPIAEKVLAWYFVRQILQAGQPLPLDECLWDLSALPNLSFLKVWVVELGDCSPCYEDPLCFLEHLFSPSSVSPNPVVLYDIHTSAGPDLAFGLRCRNQQTRKGTFVIQSKAQETVNFRDALRRVDQGLLYTSQRQREFINTKEDPKPKSKDPLHKHARNLRANYHRVLRSLGDDFGWIRAVFSVTPFPPALVAAVTQFNVTDEGHESPIILLQSSEAAFGKEMHDTLVKKCQGGGVSFSGASFELHSFDETERLLTSADTGSSNSRL